jgi:hypothetical protein
MASGTILLPTIEKSGEKPGNFRKILLFVSPEDEEWTYLAY